MRPSGMPGTASSADCPNTGHAATIDEGTARPTVAVSARMIRRCLQFAVWTRICSSVRFPVEILGAGKGRDLSSVACTFWAGFSYPPVNRGPHQGTVIFAHMLSAVCCVLKTDGILRVSLAVSDVVVQSTLALFTVAALVALAAVHIFGGSAP